MKSWLLFLGLTLLGAVTYRLVAGAGTAAPQATARHPAPISAPSKSATRSSAFRTPASEPALAGTALAGDAPSSPPSPAPTSFEVQAHLETFFTAEPLAAPSQDLTASFEQRLRGAIPAGATLRKLECRRSLCRIETSHPSLDEFASFARSTYFGPDPAGVLNGPFYAGLVNEPSSGEPAIAVAFFGRQGTLLPMPGATPEPPEPLASNAASQR